MNQADLWLMLTATGLLWLGGMVVPFVLAAHNRGQLATVLAIAQVLFPLVFGLLALAAVQSGGTTAMDPWPAWSVPLVGWAIGVYCAAGVALGGVAAIIWPGERERTLER